MRFYKNLITSASVYYIILLIVIPMFISACLPKTDKNQNPSFVQDISYLNFIDPENQYRSYPFYSLNDTLDTEEMKEQIKSFKDAGFGGFYLHSREGLLTDYLGANWWKAIDAAVEQGNASGLQTCFYDEDKWPSGFAGGIIPKMSEDYRARCLARLDKNTPLPKGSKVLKQDENYNYIEYTVQMGWAIFNGTCWVDVFNPDMVKSFIHSTYKPYIEKYKNKLNTKTFPIWADESHIHARYFDANTPDKGLLSYSPWVRKKFKELFGYDFVDKIGLLFEEKDNWRQVRLQYHQAVATQFEESFTKQIGNYCEENGVTFTGHFLGEEVLKKVMDRIGNSMLHYRNMQQPGIDHLGLSIDNSLIAAKSMTSVANQYDKSQRITEIFGISGQNMNFEDRKWIAGWHTILGINRFCPHLTLYSLKGVRKRDYPPTFSYQQPYWKYNKIIEDYMARIAYATSIGYYDPQWLVINPLESEYVRGIKESELTKSMHSLLEYLQQGHFDYDLGDEQIMNDTASISDNRLQIGRMAYSGVILPDMITIRKSTVDLLSRFIKNGGKVIYTGMFPQYMDGTEDSNALLSLKQKCISLDPDKISQLSDYITPHIKIDGENTEQVWSQVRKSDNGSVIQLYNTSHIASAEINLSSDLIKNNPVLWDPDQAKCYQLIDDTKGRIKILLDPSSTLWITTDKLSDNAKIAGSYQIPQNDQTLLVLKDQWQGEKTDPNAITLDFAGYSVDNGKTFSSQQPVIGIFQRLSEQNYTGVLTLKYLVSVMDIPKSCNLVMEQPELYSQIRMNGKPLHFIPNQFYLDHYFKVAKVDSFIKKGVNEISMTLSFEPAQPTAFDAKDRYGTEIESIYLTGDFAVKAKQIKEKWDTQRNASGNFISRPVYDLNSFYLCKEDSVFSKNLTLEGYPFYAGGFKLSQHFNIETVNKEEKFFIHLPNYEAIICEVSLNGKKQGLLTSAPFKIEVTEALREGDNELILTFTNSLRNLLGPAHHQKGELIRVGPHCFSGEGGFPDPAGDTDWYDLRLTNSPLMIWSDSYYCIPFGLLDKVYVGRS